MERWKAVAGTNGMIEVSTDGRARSLLRGVPYVLKTQTDKKGYLRLRVTINRKKMSFKMHRIVAQAFIPNPDNLPEVNHLDGDKSNNNVLNLEWCTGDENKAHARMMGLVYVSPLGSSKHKVVRDSVTGNTRCFDLINGKYVPNENFKATNCFVVNNPNPKKPIIGHNGEESRYFESVSEAERFLDSRHITDVLKGKRARVKGWTFEYCKEGGENCG